MNTSGHSTLLFIIYIVNNAHGNTAMMSAKIDTLEKDIKPTSATKLSQGIKNYITYKGKKLLSMVPK